jgi:two-component system sensor histidine kinase KdpD
MTEMDATALRRATSGQHGANPSLPARLGRAAMPHLAAIGAVAVATAIGYPLRDHVSVHDVALVLLMAVVVSALRFGFWPSVTALLLCIASYDFLFIPPVYSFSITDPGDVLAMLCFIAVAVIVSSLAAQTQRQTRDLRERIRTIMALYDFSRQAVGIGDRAALLNMTVTQFAAAAEADAVLLLPGESGLEEHAAASGRPLTRAERDAAALCWQRGQPVEPAAGQWATGERALFLPLRTPHGPLGVAAILSSQPLAPASRRLLDALIDQAAIAIERIRLAQDVDTARLQAETERLRNALLTSVSHDLRTPLAYIIGALSTLRSYGGNLDTAARAELIVTAQDEAERLDRYVGNLLDMTRLESGALAVTLDTVALDEVVSAALARAHPLLGNRAVELVMPEPPPLVEANFPLLEQMLFNLLDNAAKYAPAGSALTIIAAAEGDTAQISICDEGKGLPEAALDTVFDRFTRLAPGSQPGAGLGLAICRGFATAMGGAITAANRTDRSGAIFTITLERAE